MPEIRYIRHFYKDEKGEGKLFKTESYIVSDEQLAEEEKQRRIENILDEIDDLYTRVKALEGKGLSNGR